MNKTSLKTIWRSEGNTIMPQKNQGCLLIRTYNFFNNFLSRWSTGWWQQRVLFIVCKVLLIKKVQRRMNSVPVKCKVKCREPVVHARAKQHRAQGLMGVFGAILPRYSEELTDMKAGMKRARYPDHPGALPSATRAEWNHQAMFDSCRPTQKHSLERTVARFGGRGKIVPCQTKQQDERHTLRHFMHMTESHGRWKQNISHDETRKLKRGHGLFTSLFKDLSHLSKTMYLCSMKLVFKCISVATSKSNHL